MKDNTTAGSGGKSGLINNDNYINIHNNENEDANNNNSNINKCISELQHNVFELWKEKDN